MNAKTKADVIAWVHLIWILLGLVSLPLILFFPWWSLVFVVFAPLNVLSWVVFRGCWFLQLENNLRKRYDPSEAFEDEAFIQHYLKKYLSINCSRVTVRVIIYTYLLVVFILSLKTLQK